MLSTFAPTKIRTIEFARGAGRHGGISMKLYHYTGVEDLLPIKQRGLMPAQDLISPDYAIVWLTTQPDVSLTEQEGRAMATVLHRYEAQLSELQRQRGDEIETRPRTRSSYGPKSEHRAMNIGGRTRMVTIVSGENDDLVRLTVEVPGHDAKLHRYIKWRDRPKWPLHRFLYRLDHVQR
jgi:hypothetical protein